MVKSKGQYALADKINKSAYGKGFKTPEYLKKIRAEGAALEKSEAKRSKERAARYKKEGLK